MIFEGKTPKIDATAFIAHNTSIIGEVEIGKDSSIWFGCIIRGDVHFIKIGNRTNIQDLSMLHVTNFTKKDRSDGNPTIVGNDVTIGHKVMLHGCKIENACLVGMSATILDGAVIGKESIVGACSLVTKNKKFPPRSLIVGSPAKLIRQLNDKEVASLYDSARNYVKYKNKYL
ncbi:MAG: gamma carbonic anhydrase family protein [Sulfurospirillum sp.]|nr:gamma carbonic anhydrase family protein [Sulfurospirillum sp.]